jgi:carboxyl-terminal processing protease
VKANYVDQTDDDKLVKGAIDGMLASLDPHSSYLEGASLDRLRTMIDGGYAGLGLSVVQDDGAVKVISPCGQPGGKGGHQGGRLYHPSGWQVDRGGDLDDAVARCAARRARSIR